jgi:RNA polymerase sigma factor (sigma-70 family)
MKEFRVRLKVRNNRLIRYREELGMTPREFCDAADIGYGQYMQYEALTRSPLGGHTDPWNPLARHIAAFHGVDPEELWPDAVLQLKTSAAERTMGAEELSMVSGTSTTALPTCSAEDSFDAEELRSVASGALVLNLTPKEQKVLMMRLGFVGGEEQGLRKIGAAFQVSVERVRQIEAKSLGKLRKSMATEQRLRPFAPTRWGKAVEPDPRWLRYRSAPTPVAPFATVLTTWTCRYCGVKVPGTTQRPAGWSVTPTPRCGACGPVPPPPFVRPQRGE